jgi:glutamine amidotransferase
VIALLDYGAGNLTSVKKALAAIGADVFVPARPDELAAAGAIIVPGVGHFGSTRALNAAWIKAIREHLDLGRTLLGICLGMQWLFGGSDEAPEVPGLGVLTGRCGRIDNETTNKDVDPALRLKVPHVGWNYIEIVRDASIVRGIASGEQVYFTHSYVAPITDDVVATTEHGRHFAAVVQRENVAGVQFHPEKSGKVGLHVLRNFLELAG